MSELETRIQQAAARNADLRRTIAETDYAVPALAEHRRFLSDLQAHVRSSDERRRRMVAKRELKTKDHEKYRDSTMKRFLYKAAGKKERFAEKAEMGEREYFKALQQSLHEDKINDSLVEQLNEARNAESQLLHVVESHHSAQKELDSMYNSIFSGPTPQFPEEDDWEQRNSKALRAYQEGRTKWEGESRAYNLLVKANDLMKRGLGKMETALSYSRMDMFGGGRMTDMMERNNLSAAQQLLMEANMAVQQAHSSSPHVKQLPPVNINHGNIMSDVFFDNIFTDMAFHREIQRAQAEMLRSAVELQTQVEASRRRRDALAAGAEGHERELEASRTGLQKTRQEAFDRVAREQGIDLHQAPPTFEEATQAEAATAARATEAIPEARINDTKGGNPSNADEEWWNN